MSKDVNLYVGFVDKINNLYGKKDLTALDKLKSESLEFSEAFKYYLLCDLLGVELGDDDLFNRCCTQVLALKQQKEFEEKRLELYRY